MSKLLAILLALATLGTTTGYIILSKKINAGVEKIAAGQKQLAVGEVELAHGKARLAAGKHELSSVKQLYGSAKTSAPLLLNPVLIPIGGVAMLMTKQKIATGDRQVAEGSRRVKAGEQQIAEGKKELQEGIIRIDEAKEIRLYLGIAAIISASLLLLMTIYWIYRKLTTAKPQAVTFK